MCPDISFAINCIFSLFTKVKKQDKIAVMSQHQHLMQMFRHCKRTNLEDSVQQTKQTSGGLLIYLFCTGCPTKHDPLFFLEFIVFLTT